MSTRITWTPPSSFDQRMVGILSRGAKGGKQTREFVEAGTGPGLTESLTFK